MVRRGSIADCPHVRFDEDVSTVVPRFFPCPLALDSICAAALHCFTISGFHGTSIRQIAAEAKLSVPGIYHHFPSKDAILVRLGEIAMMELREASKLAVAGGSDTTERFDRLIACLVEFHAEFQDIAFVTFSEIRALPDIAREAHVESRRTVQRILTEVVEDGVRDGTFTTTHARHAARALTNICMGVSQWYRTNGSLNVSELVAIYIEICRDTVGFARR